MKSMLMPGEEIYDHVERVAGAYIENGKTYTSTISLFNNKYLIPLEGAWIPRIEDTVVGVVMDSRNHVYTVDLSHFGRGLLIEGKYERNSIPHGAVIEAKVRSIEDRKTVILEYPKTLVGGVVVSVKPAKIPRIIGKENTMVRQIEEITKTRMAVGFNGFIWIKGAHIEEAMLAISMIENEAHKEGLTEKVRIMLEKEVQKKENKRV
jgi:exosome complex component RRP4